MPFFQDQVSKSSKSRPITYLNWRAHKTTSINIANRMRSKRRLVVIFIIVGSKIFPRQQLPSQDCFHCFKFKQFPLVTYQNNHHNARTWCQLKLRLYTNRLFDRVNIDIDSGVVVKNFLELLRNYFPIQTIQTASDSRHCDLSHKILQSMILHLHNRAVSNESKS